MSILDELRPLFYPKSIAIIGASNNPVGGLKYLLTNKQSGYYNPETTTPESNKIYLINAKYVKEGLQGEPVYASITDSAIPKPIDLAILAAPAKYVPGYLKEMDKIVKFCVVFTSGFIESGNVELQKELDHAIAMIDTRIIGPNCLGVINPEHKLGVYPMELLPGGLAILAQSGGMLIRSYMYLTSLGLGTSKAISCGNTADLSISEMLQYFKEDDKTQTICLYLEHVHNGKKFAEIARATTPNKPIVLFKGGMSERGVKATASHTGAMASNSNVWKAMCKQNGIILAEYFEQFIDLIQVLHIHPVLPKNLNVAIVAAGGGIGIEFTDVLSAAGLNVLPLSEDSQEKLAEIFPDVNTNFANPLDLGEYGYNPSLFEKAMEIVMKDDVYGSVLFVREPDRFPIMMVAAGMKDLGKETIKSMSRLLKKYDKPIFCNLSPNKDSIEAYKLRKEFQDNMIKTGVPVLNNIIGIPPVIKKLHDYYKFLQSIQ